MTRRLFRLAVGSSLTFAMGFQLLAADIPLGPVQLMTPALRPSATAAGMSSLPILSGDGRFLLFFSTAANLMSPPDLRGVRQAYVRNLTDGSVRLASANAAGVGGNDVASDGFLSHDGRWVAFASAASDLVSGDDNEATDIFLRDLQSGEIQLVTRSVLGGSADAESSLLALTADGRYLAFSSYASDLAPGDTNGLADVFLFDRTTSSIRRISEPGLPNGTTGPSDGLEVSEDGQTAVFGSDATNLASPITDGPVSHRSNLYFQRPSPGPTRMLDVFPRGMTSALNATILRYGLSADGRYVAALVQFGSGQGATNGYYRVDLDTGKVDAIPGRVFLDRPEVALSGAGPLINSNGRWVVYEAFVDALDPETPLRPVVFGWDADTGSMTRLSSAGWVETPGPDGVGTVTTEGPWGELLGMSADGGYVAFLGGTTNDAPGAIRGQIMIRDRATGELRRLSRSTQGDPIGVEPFILGVSMSTNGHRVAFESMSTELAADDFNDDWDVFWYDWDSDVLRPGSVTGEGLQSQTGFGSSLLGTVAASENGERLAFASLSSQLTLGDGNRQLDVFVHDTSTGSNRLASVAGDGSSTGNGASRFPVLSRDGRWVAFVSDASDLVAGDTNHFDDVFLRDLETGVTTLVSRQEDGSQAIGPSRTFLASADAAWIVFATTAANLQGVVAERYLMFDRARNQIRPVATNANASTGPVPRQARAGLSPDGQWLVYYGFGTSRSGVYGWNRDSGEIRWLLPPDASPGTSAAGQDSICRFSGNGRYAVILARGSVGSRLFLYDFQTAVSTQVVASAAVGTVSDDGQRLVYLSVPAGSPPAAQVRVLDRATGVDRMLSVSPEGQPGDDSSAEPAMTPDGRYVVFSSRASNLVPGDDNEFSDVFLYDLVSDKVTRVGGDGPTTGPVLSLNARTLAFESYSGHFVANDFNANQDLFRVRLPDSESGFRVTSILRTASGEIRLTWPAQADQVYKVQGSDQLLPAGWTDLPITVESGNGQATAVDRPSSERGQRFYRVRVGP